ncbi:MAG: RNA polymerase subunit sigma, partial [Methylocystis sp.]
CGVAIGTVKSRLNRARAKLAEHLGLLNTSDIDTDPTVSDLAARRPSRAV